ncbi:A/G-specific adenine glycosylase [bacterium]|nr:A/G-specific adenine glycosylase [bacterium]
MPSPIPQKLGEWYRSNARELPWRETRDPYRIWVSEIMLQQTRVETVIPYYHQFLEAFPTVRALADAPEEELLKLWEGLGYYRRARNLQKGAQVVAHERHGRFPENADEWAELSGIGRYTAAAIASIAQDQQVAVLDGNVKRVLARLFAISRPIDERTTEKELWELAEQLVPASHPGDHNQAMMELGATLCIPKQPKCPECPLWKECDALASGRIGSIPVTSPKKKVPHKHAVAALIRRDDGGLMIWKRPPDGLLGGMWELPVVELSGAIEPQVVLQEMLKNQLQLSTKVGPILATSRHAYSHFTIAVRAFEVLASEATQSHDIWQPPLNTPFEHNSRTLAWVRPDGSSPLALHKVMLKLVDQLDDSQRKMPL